MDMFTAPRDRKAPFMVDLKFALMIRAQNLLPNLPELVDWPSALTN